MKEVNTSRTVKGEYKMEIKKRLEELSARVDKMAENVERERMRILAIEEMANEVESNVKYFEERLERDTLPQSTRLFDEETLKLYRQIYKFIINTI